MIDQTISHYKIIEKLGEGGMGVAYKVENIFEPSEKMLLYNSSAFNILNQNNEFGKFEKHDADSRHPRTV